MELVPKGKRMEPLKVPDTWSLKSVRTLWLMGVAMVVGYPWALMLLGRLLLILIRWRSGSVWVFLFCFASQ